jgi:hypothetical protein
VQLWDDKAPEPPHYFAAQRECQNAALFQMMEAAVSDPSKGPILVDPNPATQEAATANLFAFSDEARQQAAMFDNPDLVPITEVPRMRQSYGWMQFTGRELLSRVPSRLLPPYIEVNRVRRSIQRDANYTAIVYEFVEEGENDPDVVQPMLDFFWRAGFSHIMTPKASNWKSGVLVDFSDVVQPNGYGWSTRFFGYRTVRQILRGS